MSSQSKSKQGVSVMHTEKGLFVQKNNNGTCVQLSDGVYVENNYGSHSDQKSPPSSPIQFFMPPSQRRRKDESPKTSNAVFTQSGNKANRVIQTDTFVSNSSSKSSESSESSDEETSNLEKSPERARRRISLNMSGVNLAKREEHDWKKVGNAMEYNKNGTYIQAANIHLN